MTNCIKGPQTIITITIIKTHQRSRDRHNCSGCCSKCHHWSFCSCSWAVQVVFWFSIVTQLSQFVCIFYFYFYICAVQVVFHHPPILMYTLINGSIHQAWLLHNQQPRRSSSASYMWNYAGDKKLAMNEIMMMMMMMRPSVKKWKHSLGNVRSPLCPLMATFGELSNDVGGL